MTTRIWWTSRALAAVLPLGGCSPSSTTQSAQTPVLTIEAARPGEEVPVPAPPPKRAAPPARLPSCEKARARYIEGFDKTRPPDLSAGAYGAVLNRGTYLSRCGVPASMAVQVCAAVQNGRAIGVTVKTTPTDDAVADCVAAAVGEIAFPSHPRLDVTMTTFAAGD